MESRWACHLADLWNIWTDKASGKIHESYAVLTINADSHRGFMTKYKTEFKLEVVQSFLAGEGGAKLLARRGSVPEERVRTWVSLSRLHGIDGFRPKRSAYRAQFELQVLAHQDHEQLSNRHFAALYDIRNPNQILVWRHNLDSPAGVRDEE